MLRAVLLSFFLVAPVLAVPAVAWAQERPRAEAEVNDLWTELEPGVRYLDRRTSTPTHLHALVVDRARSGIEVVATPYEDRWRTVSDFAAGFPSDRLLAATNGGFWTTIGQAPLGITCSGGEHWPNAAPDPEVGTFWIDEDGAPHIDGPERIWDDAALERVVHAVGGRPILVEDGEVALSTLDTFPTANDRAPRTAIGIGRRARTLILVVVDGRQPASRGMTLYELARLLIELGADSGINLDGGGSSAMVIPDLGGVVNVPARGRWEAAMEETLASLSRLDRTREVDGTTELWVHGREREVMSHLAFLRRPRARAITGPEEDLVPGLAPPLGAPPPLRPGLIRLAILREWLVPLGYLLGLVAVVGLLGQLASKLARRLRTSLLV